METNLDSQLTLSYDREGDVLYVDALTPYAEQDSDEIGDGIVARMNPESGDVENLEVLFFSSRFGELESKLHLPLGARFSPPLAG